MRISDWSSDVCSSDLGLPGLTGQTAISRDSRGVVYITAETPADASFALGFAHAQDRLWQMEMTRRIGAGRLAEMVGDAALTIARMRSEERRVGKGWVSTCSSRCTTVTNNKNNKITNQL